MKLIEKCILNHTCFDFSYLVVVQRYVELNRQKIPSWFELDSVPTELKLAMCEFNIHTVVI